MIFFARASPVKLVMQGAIPARARIAIISCSRSMGHCRLCRLFFYTATASQQNLQSFSSPKNWGTDMNFFR
eukprot:1641286-Amphidinium_carterae.1